MNATMTGEKSATETSEKEGPSGKQSDRRLPVYSPAVDIYEEEDRFVVFADIPGASESNVEISLEKDRLSLRAEVDEEFQGQGALRFAEYGIGGYARSFRPGKEVDRDHIEATVRDGVLKLVLPKIPSSIKKIQVRAD